MESEIRFIQGSHSLSAGDFSSKAGNVSSKTGRRQQQAEPKTKQQANKPRTLAVTHFHEKNIACSNTFSLVTVSEQGKTKSDIWTNVATRQSRLGVRVLGHVDPPVYQFDLYGTEQCKGALKTHSEPSFERFVHAPGR